MNIKEFYTPVTDKTNRVYLMRYCNNGLSYGVSNPATENKFFLCSSPLNSAEILEIISEHETEQQMRTAFYEQKFNILN